MDLSQLTPDIYEAAAGDLLNGEADFCCHAIARVTQGPNWQITVEDDPHTAALLHCYDPRKAPERERPAYYWSAHSNRDREARVIALLLLADMVRDAQRAAR
jgi:hypothetical protein